MCCVLSWRGGVRGLLCEPLQRSSSPQIRMSIQEKGRVSWKHACWRAEEPSCRQRKFLNGDRSKTEYQALIHEGLQSQETHVLLLEWVIPDVASQTRPFLCARQRGRKASVSRFLTTHAVSSPKPAPCQVKRNRCLPSCSNLGLKHRSLSGSEWLQVTWRQKFTISVKTVGVIEFSETQTL